MDSQLSISICHANPLLSDCLSVALEDSFGRQGIGIESEALRYDRNAPKKILFGLETNFLIIDASLDPNFLESLIFAARRKVEDCKVILLLRDFEIADPGELFSLQTNGCVFSESSFNELISAINCICAGEYYCSSEVANSFFARMNRADFERPTWLKDLDSPRLTGREREVLELIAWERLGNKQIARRLNISLYTVKNHVHNILEKLGVEDRHEAVAFAKKQRILIAAT